MKNFYYLFAISIIIFYSTLNAQWLQTNVPSGGAGLIVTISGTSLFAVSYIAQQAFYFFVSTDKGATWTPTHYFSSDRGPTALAGNGTNIFAGYFFSHALYLSTNNGTEWKLVNSFPSPRWITALTINGVNVLVGTMSGGVHLSTNNGTNWTSSILDDSVSISSFIFSETNIFAGTYGAGIFLSTDNGGSWIPVNNGLTDTFVNSLVVSGANIFAGTNSGVYLSTDNGTNWTLVNNGLNNIFIKSLAVSGSNIFAGTDGDGVYLSTNSGTSWTQVNDGLTNGEVFSLTVGGEYIFAGTSVGVFRRPLTEILPVELTTFTATANSKEVILNWSTATELNNQGFEVQRKFGSNDFATIGFIKGEGTTTNQKEYSYADKNLEGGKYFYRLKQLDFNENIITLIQLKLMLDY